MDHNKRDKKSHIYTHCNNSSHPYFSLNSFKMFDRNCGNRVKRKINEDLLINGLTRS